MKIQKVRFFNFRNVPDMEKQIAGSNILLLAENTKGKSNFIKGLKAALCGELGPGAIRQGQDKAEVEIALAEYENAQPIEGSEYTFKLIVKKDKDGSERAGVEVKAPNGFKETKKTVIGTIAGEVELEYDFVELSRTDKGRKQQLEILRGLLDDETRTALELFENKAAQAYAERTEVNREIKRLEGWIATQGMDRELVEKYGAQENIDIGGLQTQIAKAHEHNSKRADVDRRLGDRGHQIQKNQTEIRNLELKIESIRRENAELDKLNIQASEWLGSNKEITSAALEQELSQAIETNKIIDRAKGLQGSLTELSQHKDRSGELTALHDSSKQAIADAIRDMHSPIEGLSFDENNAYYNGKLIHPDQLSTSEIMEFDIRLLIAKRQATKAGADKSLADVLFVERGESFGMGKLIELQKAATACGYQVIMEQVERGTEELRVELMPDYLQTKTTANA